MSMIRRTTLILAGPLILILCIFLLPRSVFPGFSSRAAIGTVAFIAFWWVTAPVDYAITGFLPIVLNAILQMTDMSRVISNYASETIILLLGASILTVSWGLTGLDQRIAAMLLSLIGDSLRNQVIFWYLFAAILSAVLPNAVVAATITPIAAAMLNYVGEGDIAKSRKGSKLLLTVVYAAGVGGLATPLGGAMNLVTVDYLQQISGKEYLYTSWVAHFLPIMLIIVVSNILFLLGDVKKDDTLGGSRQYFLDNYRKMGKMTSEQRWSLGLFLAAAALSFTRQFYQGLLPGLKPAYVFLACAVLSFLVRGSDGKRLMVWKKVQTKLIWEMIYIFAGGLAAGTLMNESGAAQDIGDAIAGISMKGGFLMIFVIITFTLLLSDITSNTATAAVSLPIIISITQGAGLDPVPYIYIATIGVNLSYMLPTSIRAIPVGYGLEPRYMLKNGWKLTVITIVLMSCASWLLLKYWPYFSTL